MARRRRARRLFTLAGCIWITACAVPAPPEIPEDRWWEARPGAGATASPTPLPEPRCSIAVLEAEPSEPFQVLALLEIASQGPHPDAESALEAARLQACALGGDAVVVLYRRAPRRSGFDVPSSPGGVFPDPALRVAVIRYR